ncbi:MAG TPA: hypothetical protein VE007_12310 [Thermoanaerobaculia bacterium]|nr:hypothetical protein [Thermoanaerobaculia bacterium]
MKKVLTMLVAVAALAAFAGPASAITCTIDHKPAATLLVPYFQVAVSAATATAPRVIGTATGTDFADTFMTVLNASAEPELAHVTVWNRRSVPVLDFNIALTGFDTISWSMAQVLSGNLPNNPAAEDLAGGNACKDTSGPGHFVKFTGSASGNDSSASTVYTNPVFTGFAFQLAAELDGTDDCAVGGETSLAADPDVLSGYVTIDMVNYCSFANPNDPNYYEANTIGFENALWGDYIFQSGAGVPTYGQPMIALEADVDEVPPFSRILTPATNSGSSKNIYFPLPSPPVAGTVTTGFQGDLNGYRLGTGDDVLRTFYARYWEVISGPHVSTISSISDTGTESTDATNYFSTIGLNHPPVGDMREPLGIAYGARYFDDASGLTSFLRAWRASAGDLTDLTGDDCTAVEPNVLTVIWDEDEVPAQQTGCTVSPCPPGQHFNFPYETQREGIEEFAGVQGHNGWVYVDFADPSSDSAVTDLDQAWLGYDLQGAGAFANAGIDGVSFDTTNCNPAGLDSIGVIPGVPVPANADGFTGSSSF